MTEVPYVSVSKMKLNMHTYNCTLECNSIFSGIGHAYSTEKQEMEK